MSAATQGSTESPVLNGGGKSYRWIDDWCVLPATSRSNGRTHGIHELKDRRVVLFHQSEPAILILDADGKIIDSFGEYMGAHGLTVVTEDDGTQNLWVTDQVHKVVHKLSLTGELLMELASPPEAELAKSSNPKYVPTWAAVGPDGDIWVADGYGSSLIFRYDGAGKFKSIHDGTDAAGRYNCPHGIAFDDQGQLWIADRGNQRVIICDADGKALKHSDGACHSPCMFDFHDGNAYIPELSTGVKVLDGDLNVVASVCEDPEVIPSAGKKPIGWPDRPRAHLTAGKFSSPHGLGVGADGSIFVAEWICGGRVTKLEIQ